MTRPRIHVSRDHNAVVLQWRPDGPRYVATPTALDQLDELHAGAVLTADEWIELQGHHPANAAAASSSSAPAPADPGPWAPSDEQDQAVLVVTLEDAAALLGVPAPTATPAVDVRPIYSERAALVAYLAAHFPAVVSRNDPECPEYDVLYVDASAELGAEAGQLTWHIHPDDLEHLMAHVRRVEPTDARAQWDGHTTEEKYRRVAKLIRRALIRRAMMAHRYATGRVQRTPDVVAQMASQTGVSLEDAGANLRANTRQLVDVDEHQADASTD